MGIIDRFRNKGRIKDVGQAMEEALVEEQARKNVMLKRKEREVEENMNEDSSGEGTQARGRGGSLFNFNLDIVKPNKAPFWIWIGLLIFLIIAWSNNYFGFRNTLIAFGLTLLPFISLLIIIGFIVWGFSTGFKSGNMANVFIAGALSVWLIDLIPINFPVIGQFLGFEWAGYQVPVKIPYFSIMFSTVAFAFLYINMILKIIEKNYISTFIAFTFIIVSNLIILNYFPGYADFGITLPTLSTLKSIGVIAGTCLILGIIGFLAWHFDRRHRATAIPGFLSYLYMTFVFTFFWMNFYQFGTRAWIHAIFDIAFGFGYVKSKESNPVAMNIWLPTLLIVDFFGYGILWASDYPSLKFIPPAVLFVIFYCYEKEAKSGQKNYTYPVMAFILLITFILIMSVNVAGLENAGVPLTAKKGASFKDLYGEFSTKLKGIIEGSLDTATGGLYRGNVEKNRYESLGVYFANIRAADPRFYTNEPITVWGTIRSKTYQDAVIINFSCYRWKDGRRIGADRSSPGFKFPIFTLEEIDTECIFLPSKQKGKEVPSGTNTVTFSAEYNFGTDAYLKTYFIDRERFRGYTRENIEPLNALGIKDKNPVSVSTNGPVEIGMKAGPLVTVSEGYSIKPTIGISLLNRQEISDKDKKIISRWDGKIKNITELVLLVPPGVLLTKNDGTPLGPEPCTSKEIREGACPCNMPFREYSQQDCESTCETQVKEPCHLACETTNKESSALASCKRECDSTADRCKNECSRLFQPESDEFGSGEYKAYALDVGSLEFRDLNKDIDKYRTFNCRYEAKTGVLGEGPYTTRYFRVRARYNYLLENSVTVNVEAPPDESKTVVPNQVYSIATESAQTYNSLYFPGLTPEIINGIASVESRFRHCCTDQTKNRAYNCVDSGEKDCDPRYIITSGTSIGIMQIKYDTPATIAEVDRIAGEVCGGTTIYNYDCNVKIGIAILKSKYNWARYGCKETTEFKSGDTIKYKTFIDGCQNGITSTGIRYDSYKDLDAALRGYNGWGRDSRFDVDYVEKVKRAAQSISGKDIIDPVTLGSAVRGGSGMVDPSLSQAEEPYP